MSNITQDQIKANQDARYIQLMEEERQLIKVRAIHINLLDNFNTTLFSIDNALEKTRAQLLELEREIEKRFLYKK